jgi:predicted HAD superfamily Cof-like phosphohydrolase
MVVPAMCLECLEGARIVDRNALKEARKWLDTRVSTHVLQFHRLVGHPVREKPGIPDEDEVRLRAHLITEEFFEVLHALFSRAERNNIDDRYKELIEFIDDAWVKVNLPEFADGLADLDYVVEGARLVFGINGVPIAAEVHRANMTKAQGPKRADGKILKPEGWKPPDIEGELRKQGWKGL